MTWRWWNLTDVSEEETASSLKVQESSAPKEEAACYSRIFIGEHGVVF
jgi:hypothetical protein